MKTWHGRAVILYLASALLFACAPMPVVPSGKSRIPVNSDEGISQYRERVKIDQRERLAFAENAMTDQDWIEAFLTSVPDIRR